MIPDNFTRSWWGSCKRVSPDVRYCVVHESAMENGSNCIVYNNYLAFATMIIEACREHDV